MPYLYRSNIRLILPFCQDGIALYNEHSQLYSGCRNDAASRFVMLHVDVDIRSFHSNNPK